jgi:hypothetical protein
LSVEKDLTRKAVQISWDCELTFGDEVDIRLTNPDNDDVSEATGPNSGQHVITYPADYTGETQVVVTGSEGGEDDGWITV